MARTSRPAAPRADAAKSAPTPPRSSGQGADSAYTEMLKRQAQAPRPVPATEREREPRPQAPKRER